MSATTNQAFFDYQTDFEGAITRYSPILFRVALRRLRNIEDAEDAVQDALLSAHKHIDQFEGRSKLSTWLTRIVTNVALMKLRRHPRHEMLSLEQDQENDRPALVSELKDEKPNPETICAQTETNERIRVALEQLSPKMRSAIQLCDLDGLSVLEVANTLGISKNTLKSRIARGRASLNLILGEVNGTRPTAKVASAVNRTDIACRRSPALGEGTSVGAEPIGYKSRICRSSVVSASRHNEAHNNAEVRSERARNCYPPHSLQNALHPYPQGYAT